MGLRIITYHHTLTPVRFPNVSLRFLTFPNKGNLGNHFQRNLVKVHGKPVWT